jgi:hypothetical protein
MPSTSVLAETVGGVLVRSQDRALPARNLLHAPLASNDRVHSANEHESASSVFCSARTRIEKSALLLRTDPTVSDALIAPFHTSGLDETQHCRDGSETAVTVIVSRVWAVTSDPSGRSSGLAAG